MFGEKSQVSRWRHEEPTWFVAIAVYGGWGLLTWHYAALPWWAVLVAGAWLTSWHGSLQHEAVHGHPTRRGWLNALLVMPPLGLWLPYPVYRTRHLEHHGSRRLTDPLDDPESFYVSEDRWWRMTPPRRALLVANNTLAGRLAVGPAVAILGAWGGEGRLILAGDRRRLAIWLIHGGLVGLVLGWVVVVCGIPFLAYVGLFVYPGLSLTLIRSYLEHRPASRPGHRTAIVEAGWPLALLFLNNNLHAVHHDRPGLPWYRLPAAYRDRLGHYRHANGGYVFPGYGTVARRHLFRPKDRPVHP